ncbi:hypothetical protein ACJIZ3_015488 [Penstemon smallii]|uniref:Uncharacterized protein n=1 Tax=Penstemon smallii TaxID=265156 RepID=A0ABD3RMM3_9LAMI
MACLNMLNNEQHQHLYNNSIGPRISFSNDFADFQQTMKQENSYREAPVSSDFEFSLPNKTMITADELFSKGKLLPMKENCTKITTLRDELRAGDDEYDDVQPRLSKGTSRWKQRLGLKRSHIVPMRSDKVIEGALERIDETRATNMTCEDVFAKFEGSF